MTPRSIVYYRVPTRSLAKHAALLQTNASPDVCFQKRHLLDGVATATTPSSPQSGICCTSHRSCPTKASCSRALARPSISKLFGNGRGLTKVARVFTSQIIAGSKVRRQARYLVDCRHPDETLEYATTKVTKPNAKMRRAMAREKKVVVAKVVNPKQYVFVSCLR